MMSMLRLKAAGDTCLMNKFIRQNFAFATKKKRLYLGCFRSDSNKPLLRHCEIWKFRVVVFLLIGRSRFMAML